MKHVLVGLSGGVDSAVAALLLKRSGIRVTGAFMSNGVRVETRNEKSCCSVDDAYDARRVADALEIPFYALNFEDGFAKLIDTFVGEYQRGRTPNPCVLCNRLLKFGRMFDFADAVGADAVATGHYARVDATGLRRAADPAKDQSYMLFNVPRERLARIELPLGALSKPRVREIAREAGLPVMDKPDSMGVCFIPDGDLEGFLSARTAMRPGEVRAEGGVVGTHGGFQRFTLGQRRGLGVAMGEPRYVTRIEPEENAVYLGPPEELMASRFEVGDVNWLVDPSDPQAAEIQIRYRGRAHPGRIAGSVVELNAPARAITPGQAAVFYDGPRVLGGGWIRRVS